MRLKQGDTKWKKVGKVSKLGMKIHCSKCGGKGHNMKTCIASVTK